MADIQKLYEEETFNADTAEHETEPQEAVNPGEVEELDGNYKKITINKKGIYVGESLEELHLFVNQADLENLKKSLEEQIAAHPSKEEVYTQNQVNSLLLEKANSNDVYTKSNTYNQSELNSKFNTKAEVANTYDKIDTDRNFLRINDFPVSVNSLIGYEDRTDQELSKSPFKEDSLIFTQDQYDKLSDSEKNNNKMYFIVDGTSEELLGSVKPILTSGSVKVVKSGGTLELTFTLRTQVTLIATCDTGTITVSGNTAIYTAPQVSENTPTVLHFKGSRNNLESQSLDIPITIMAVAEDVKVISFDGNGASSGKMEPISIIKNENGKWSYTLDYNNFVPPYNMEFKGWATSVSDESTFLGSVGTIEFDNAEPLTLYAIWQNSNTRQCVIRYEANGGTKIDGYDDRYEKTVSLGSYFVEASDIFTPPVGKVFLYWSQSSLGNTGQVQADAAIELRYAGEMTFFAIWGTLNSDVFIKPATPTVKAGNLWVYENQTQVITFNASYVLKLHVDSELAGNEVQVQGNTLVVKGIVPLSTMKLIVYQTSGQGVDSDMNYIDVEVRESIPDTPLVVENQIYETTLNTPLEIQFQNIDENCQIKVSEASDTSAVTIADNKVYVTSNAAKTITFKVSQFRTGVQGAVLESVPCDISVEVTN